MDVNTQESAVGEEKVVEKDKSGEDEREVEKRKCQKAGDHERIFVWDRNGIQRKVTLAATHMVRPLRQQVEAAYRTQNKFSQA